MIKPLPFEGSSNIPMIAKPSGLAINFPSVFTSNWVSQEGRKAQFFVNNLPEEKEIIIDISTLKDVSIHKDADDSNGEKAEQGKLTIKLPVLSAVMITYSR